MLLNLYNQKDQSEYADMYCNVVLSIKKQIERAGGVWEGKKFKAGQAHLMPDAKMILDQFVYCIQKLMKNVQMKIIEDAFKDNLIEEQLIENIPVSKDKKQQEEDITRQLIKEKQFPAGFFLTHKYIKDLNQEKLVITKIKREYKEDWQKYDDIVSAVGEYFDLFKTNTIRLECLWLQLLSFFNFDPP